MIANMKADIAYEAGLKERTELESITRPLLNRYASFMEEIFGDDLIAVAAFGSLARGTAEFPGSDIDLLIVLEGIEKLSLAKG